MTYSITNQLKRDQTNAFDKLKKLRVGALFMEAGVGKTLVTLQLIKNTDSSFALFIVPLRTKKNLIKEIEKWSFNLPYHIVGLESLSLSDKIFLETLAIAEQCNNLFVIVDESLKIKNDSAKRTKRSIEIGKFAKYKLILNGTPISKNIMDLWSQMQFLSPKILNMSYAQFKDTFIEYVTITQTKKVSRQTRTWEEIIDHHNFDYLMKLIDPYIFQADLEIDKNKRYFNFTYQLSNDELEVYADLKKYYLEKIEKNFTNTNYFLAMVSKLQFSYSTAQEKFDSVDSILRRREQKKSIIFCKFVASRKALEKKYTEAKILTYGTSAFGLNLQEYNTIIFFDKTFDYAEREQTEHRIYRTGQQDDCFFYDLTNDSINLDNTIDVNITEKTSLSERLKKAINNSEPMAELI